MGTLTAIGLLLNRIYTRIDRLEDRINSKIDSDKGNKQVAIKV